mgnify:CR=1 FL=1
MNVLIVYTPRSKSQLLHDVLVKKLQLHGYGDILTRTRIAANDDLTALNTVVDKINAASNFCLKINGHDFIDLKNQKISDLYKKIDYSKFHKIIFLKRDSFTDALLSYGYMDRNDPMSWHRKKGAVIPNRDYQIDINKVYFLSRGYAIYDQLTKYISSIYHNEIIKCEFNQVEALLKSKFDIDRYDIDLQANEIDYKALLINKQILDDVESIFKKICLTLPEDEYFWTGIKHVL